MFKHLVIGAAATALLSIAAIADPVFIHAGTLLAKPGDAPKTNQTLVVDEGVIIEQHDGFLRPEGAKVIDLSDQFVMPGMFDMHVHIQGQLGPNNDRDTLRMSAEDIGMRSALYARRTLMAGFTTVRDLGAGAQQQLFSLKRAVDAGWIDGPRIIAGTGVNVTGSHGDVDGMRHELLHLFTPHTICNGPYDCRGKVREAVKFGADVIKITATGGVLSDTDTGTGLQMRMDEMREIVQTAHALGRRVAAHAHAADGIRAALEAGVDSIEHGTYGDKAAMKLYKSKGSYLVPTLLAGATVVDMAKAGGLGSDDIRQKAIRVGADMETAFRLASKSGVNIAYGTDSGVSAHGMNAREAELMVRYGMSEMDVLVSATVTAAELANLSEQLGTLEGGKIADVIAMDASPLEDITALQRVRFVMKEGRVVKG